MPWDTIERTEYDEGIVRISLDRPETHNAQNPKLIDELDEALQQAERDRNVVIVDGNGPSFSSGHDMGRDGFKDEWTIEDRFEYELDYYFERSLEWRDLEIPTIAQIHGYCGAAGMMLMSVCDLAVTAEDAVFENPVMRMGGAGVELLFEPWDVGFRKAKELLWTGDSISGSEAAQLGLVNAAVDSDDLEAETMRLAMKVARMPSFVLRLSKHSFRFAEDRMGQLDSYRYHFMAHQMSHASRDWVEWHDSAQDVLEEEGLEGFVEYRDSPFEIDSEDVEEVLSE